MRCREIVKGLLEFSRQSATEACATDVRAVVERTRSLMQQQASFLNIRTVLRFSEEDLPHLLIDPGQLQQVIMNLVLNAVDAMDERGELTVQTLSGPVANQVILRVQDTGKGIAPENQPSIFDPFFTTKEVGRGTGLGLAIVHGIVSRAGGTIEVASVPGQGTVFTIRLPAVSLDRPGTARAQPPAASRPGASAAPPSSAGQSAPPSRSGAK